MALFKLYVDSLFESDTGVYGIENDITRIRKNMSVMYHQHDIEYLQNEAKKNKEGISHLHQFCQFIVYLILHQDLNSGQITFFDCRNDMNIALDIYNQFTKEGWDKLPKESFMKWFLEIEKEYEKVKDVAELTTDLS